MSDRPTLAELAAKSSEPTTSTINGKPADICPFCGAGMFVNGTNTLTTTIERHVYCRNEKCGRGFISRQPPAVLVREINRHDKISSSGIVQLTVHRESA